jgi:hypothetical protein
MEGVTAMSKKKRTPEQPLAGSSSAAGSGFRPVDVPEQHGGAAAPKGGAVPIGLPIDAAEYERLQQKAKRRKVPQADCAQEDPGKAPGS